MRRPQMRSRASLELLFALTFIMFCVAAAAATHLVHFAVKPLPLPGGNGLVTLDYFAYDPASRLLWVPAANTGSVDVIDTTTDQIKRVEGFPVAQVEIRGKLRPMGPSSVAIGDGSVYIGSRGDSKICIIDSHTFARGKCVVFANSSAGLAAAPDGLIYIAATRELWATSGSPAFGVPAADRSIKIFSATVKSGLDPAGKIPLPGSAEGYAVDNKNGRFYTNLEETGQTAAIDVREHKVVSTWSSCSDASGLAVDGKRGFVFVACTDHVIVLDVAHNGQIVGEIKTGGGVDNIDYAEDTRRLYVASAETAQLTVARIEKNGKPVLLARVPTAKGARSVVAGSRGHAYLIDPFAGQILKVVPQ